MSKWFDQVINDYVNKNQFVNYKMTINNLSEKQLSTFKSCMKFSHNKLYTYENNNYEVDLINSKDSWKCALIITNRKQVKIDNLKAEIAQLKNEIAEENNKEWVEEDMEQLEQLENELLQLEAV